MRISLLLVFVCAGAFAAFGQFVGPGVFQAKDDPVTTDFNKAYASMKAGDFSSAEAPLKRVLTAEPKHISANYMMGVICQAKEDYAASIRYLNVAIEQHEANPHPIFHPKSELAEYYKTRADTYGYQGNFASAIKDVTTAIGLDPEMEDFYYVSRAWFELYAQRNAEAYKDAMTGIEKGAESENKPAIVAVIALRRMGKTEEIRKLLPGAASSIPPVMQYIRGDITSAQLLQMTTDKEAQVWFRAIVGEIARINGDKKTAREHFEWVKTNGDLSDSLVRMATSSLTELGQ
jgi:tetratricopeptide (TPR) repeat protein